jgi:hypothetical protein
VEQPLGKVFKRPSFKKAVDSGVMTEDEARVAEAMVAGIFGKRKPSTQKRTSMARATVVKWAEDTYKDIERLNEFINGDGDRRREIMKELEEVKPQDEAREREAFEYVKRLNPTWKPLEPVFTPDAVAVAMKVMERAGWAAGEKFELDLRIKADRTNQSYYVEDGGGKRVYWIDGYRDLDKMIDQIVAVMKLRRGDSDTVLPSRWFKIKGVDPIMRPSGKYRVHYATSTRGLNTSEKDFATKQEAEAFAKAKTDKGLWNNVFELQEYSGECKSYKTR